MSGCSILLKSCMRIEFPTAIWREDLLIPTPQLIYPRSEQTFCLDVLPGGDTQICLAWEDITEASHYLLQWSLNPEFNGPSVREEIVASPLTQYCLFLTDDIRQGTTVYWRVIAANLTTGGVSNKSETRKLTYNCNSSQNNHTANKCDRYNVELNIIGSDSMECCDYATLGLVATFDCKTSLSSCELSSDVIEVADIEWRVQSPIQGAASLETVLQNGIQAINKYAIGVRSCAEQTQQIQICAKVTFNDLTDASQFSCETCHKIFVDCKDSSKLPFNAGPLVRIPKEFVTTTDKTPMEMGEKLAPTDCGCAKDCSFTFYSEDFVDVGFVGLFNGSETSQKYEDCTLIHSWIVVLAAGFAAADLDFDFIQTFAGTTTVDGELITGNFTVQYTGEELTLAITHTDPCFKETGPDLDPTSTDFGFIVSTAGSVSDAKIGYQVSCAVEKDVSVVHLCGPVYQVEQKETWPLCSVPEDSCCESNVITVDGRVMEIGVPQTWYEDCCCEGTDGTQIVTIELYAVSVADSEIDASFRIDRTCDGVTETEFENTTIRCCVADSLFADGTTFDCPACIDFSADATFIGQVPTPGDECGSTTFTFEFDVTCDGETRTTGSVDIIKSCDAEGTTDYNVDLFPELGCGPTVFHFEIDEATWLGSVAEEACNHYGLGISTGTYNQTTEQPQECECVPSETSLCLEYNSIKQCFDYDRVSGVWLPADREIPEATLDDKTFRVEDLYFDGCDLTADICWAPSECTSCWAAACPCVNDCGFYKKTFNATLEFTAINVPLIFTLDCTSDNYVSDEFIFAETPGCQLRGNVYIDSSGDVYILGTVINSTPVRIDLGTFSLDCPFVEIDVTTNFDIPCPNLDPPSSQTISLNILFNEMNCVSDCDADSYILAVQECDPLEASITTSIDAKEFIVSVESDPITEACEGCSDTTANNNPLEARVNIPFDPCTISTTNGIGVDLDKIFGLSQNEEKPQFQLSTDGFDEGCPKITPLVCECLPDGEKLYINSIHQGTLNEDIAAGAIGQVLLEEFNTSVFVTNIGTTDALEDEETLVFVTNECYLVILSGSGGEDTDPPLSDCCCCVHSGFCIKLNGVEYPVYTGVAQTIDITECCPGLECDLLELKVEKIFCFENPTARSKTHVVEFTVCCDAVEIYSVELEFELSCLEKECTVINLSIPGCPIMIAVGNACDCLDDVICSCTCIPVDNCPGGSCWAGCVDFTLPAGIFSENVFKLGLTAIGQYSGDYLLTKTGDHLTGCTDAVFGAPSWDLYDGESYRLSITVDVQPNVGDLDFEVTLDIRPPTAAGSWPLGGIDYIKTTALSVICDGLTVTFDEPDRQPDDADCPLGNQLYNGSILDLDVGTNCQMNAQPCHQYLDVGELLSFSDSLTGAIPDTPNWQANPFGNRVKDPSNYEVDGTCSFFIGTYDFDSTDLLGMFKALYYDPAATYTLSFDLCIDYTTPQFGDPGTGYFGGSTQVSLWGTSLIHITSNIYSEFGDFYKQCSSFTDPSLNTHPGSGPQAGEFFVPPGILSVTNTMTPTGTPGEFALVSTANGFQYRNEVIIIGLLDTCNVNVGVALDMSTDGPILLGPTEIPANSGVGISNIVYTNSLGYTGLSGVDGPCDDPIIV